MDYSTPSQSVNYPTIYVNVPVNNGCQTNVHPVQVIASGVLLDPYALTIGFARRFATYKRANLILHDIDRLIKIIDRPESACTNHLCWQSSSFR